MKYPLDSESLQDIVKKLSDHDKLQREYVDKLLKSLEFAVEETTDTDSVWYTEALEILEETKQARINNENRRFHENTMKLAQDLKKPEPTIERAEIKVKKAKRISLPEPEYDGEMSEEELRDFFKEKYSKSVKGANFKELSKSDLKKLEKIEEWEQAQNNSSDVYKIAARVKNAVRMSGLTLSPQGDALCNSFVHFAKGFYDFTEKVQDRALKKQMMEYMLNNEDFPAKFIAASANMVGVPKGQIGG